MASYIAKYTENCGKSEMCFNGFRDACVIFSGSTGVNTCERRMWTGGNTGTPYKSGPTAEPYGVR